MSTIWCQHLISFIQWPYSISVMLHYNHYYVFNHASQIFNIIRRLHIWWKVFLFLFSFFGHLVIYTIVKELTWLEKPWEAMGSKNIILSKFFPNALLFLEPVDVKKIQFAFRCWEEFPDEAVRQSYLVWGITLWSIYFITFNLHYIIFQYSFPTHNVSGQCCIHITD